MRASLAEHLPNPVSPLFATLGLRLANAASARLFQQLGADPVSMDYRYLTVNGYVYLSFAMNLRVAWVMTKMSVSQLGAVLGKGTERWRGARRALAVLTAKWEAKPVASLPPSDLLQGVREVLLEAANYYTVIQSGALPTASTSETIFTRVYNLVKRQGDPDAAALLFGFDTVALLAEKSLFDWAGWANTRPALREYALHTSTPPTWPAVCGAGSRPGALPPKTGPNGAPVSSDISATSATPPTSSTS